MGFLSRNKKISGWMAIGLEADGIAVVHVVRAGGMPSIELAMFFPGESSSADGLESAAKEVRAANHQCTTVLGAGEYQLLSVEAPNVPADELKAAIRWRLKDLLDFHINDATIDVLDVPVDKNAPARNHSMFAVAARNQIIEQRQTLFSEAKIPLSVIDIPEMAQRNISELLQPEGRGIAMLSFDAGGGLLTVTYGGDLYLSRRIEVSLEQLLEGEQEQRTANYDRITLELQRSLDHFDRQYHFITMSKFILAPIAGGAEPFRDYLASNIYLPVENLDFESVLDLSKVPELKSLDQQQRFFMTLGAALRHEEKVL